jgi:hypothetical protein
MSGLFLLDDGFSHPPVEGAQFNSKLAHKLSRREKRS